MKTLIKAILITLCIAAAGPASAVTIAAGSAVVADMGWSYQPSVLTIAERVLALEKSMGVMEATQKEALKLAREQMESRMDGFPQQYAMKGDIKGELEVVKIEIESIKKDIATCKTCQAILAEKASHNSVMITICISILGLFMAGIALVFRAYKV